MLATEEPVTYDRGMDAEILTFRIHLEPEPEGGYTVTVPALPGCVTWGESYEHALEMAQECIEGFLEALAKAGDPIPRETHQLMDVLVSVRFPA
jgi:predicted RNase H-like HicB family nuclease